MIRNIVVFLCVVGIPFGVHAQEVSVPVVFHRQEHSLSCEVAALKMALGAQGVEVAEQELISKLPFDPTLRTNGVWGDPNIGFVGKIDGQMMVDGYGVHWDPIAKLGQKYAATEVMRAGSVSQLAKHIKNGNPVIIWMHYGNGQTHTWNTIKGKKITGIHGEHTIVAYGFDGPAHAPTRLYTMDPVIGKESWTPSELTGKWNALGRMGVVVRPRYQFVRLPNDTQIWHINSAQKIRYAIETWKEFIALRTSGQSIKTVDNRTLSTYTRRSTPL